MGSLKFDQNTIALWVSWLSLGHNNQHSQEKNLVQIWMYD